MSETFVDLLRDPNHWGMELVVEAVTGVFGFLWARAWLRHHDKVAHGHDVVEKVFQKVQRESWGDRRPPVFAPNDYRDQPVKMVENHTGTFYCLWCSNHYAHKNERDAHEILNHGSP